MAEAGPLDGEPLPLPLPLGVHDGDGDGEPDADAELVGAAGAPEGDGESVGGSSGAPPSVGTCASQRDGAQPARAPVPDAPAMSNTTSCPIMALPPSTPPPLWLSYTARQYAPLQLVAAAGSSGEGRGVGA